jgi:hypothetical protein
MNYSENIPGKTNKFIALMPYSCEQNLGFNNTPQPSMIEKYLEQQKKVEGVLLLHDLPLVDSYQMLQKNPAQFFLAP